MSPRYDVFLSHGSADKPAVEEIARKLRRIEQGGDLYDQAGPGAGFYDIEAPRGEQALFLFEMLA